MNDVNKVCSCPSGDGSLRHPCPTHPPLADSQPVKGLSWADYWIERGQSDVAHDFDAFSRAEAWALQRFPSAGQPVGQLSDAEIDARLNTLYRDMVASGRHNGGMSGVAWDRAVYRMASISPAQAGVLGQFREAVEMAFEVEIKDWAQRQRLEGLLALIDSQAVGNG